MSKYIVLGFNDTSTLVGHFMSFPREREKRARRESRWDEREGHGRWKEMNESEETEVKTFPQRQSTILWTCATREASNKPAQSRSLIRIFTGHILDSKECLFLCRQQKLWSDCSFVCSLFQNVFQMFCLICLLCKMVVCTIVSLNEFILRGKRKYTLFECPNNVV